MNVPQELLELTSWWQCTEEGQRGIVAEIARQLRGEFSFQSFRSFSSDPNRRIATFVHEATQRPYSLVPGGEFSMGLSSEEQLVLAEEYSVDPSLFEDSTPAHKVKVEPFLIGRTPVDVELALRFTEFEHAFRPDFSRDGEAYEPVYLTEGERAAILRASGLSLPTEAQFEYAFRGGTDTLFWFGNDLPGDEILDGTILRTTFGSQDQLDACSNAFGLAALGVSHLCADGYCKYPKGDACAGLPKAVRSGAAAFWPWQDADEWFFLMSASRHSERELEDGTCAIRLIRSLS